MNTSRHIFPLVFLARALGGTAAYRRMMNGQLRVLEVGGGLGNMLRLLHNAIGGFSEWAAIDLPLASRLQRWYLRYTLTTAFSTPRVCALIYSPDHDVGTLWDENDSECGAIQAREWARQDCKGFSDAPADIKICAECSRKSYR